MVSFKVFAEPYSKEALKRRYHAPFTPLNNQKPVKRRYHASLVIEINEKPEKRRYHAKILNLSRYHASLVKIGYLTQKPE